MAWLDLFPRQSERTRLQEQKETPLQLETLEKRNLLSVEPMIIDINQYSRSSSPRELVDVDGILYFSANDGSIGYELWKSDGTALGTQLVKDINTNPNGSRSSGPSSLINIDGTLYFSADDGTNGRSLWKSDGTSSGTERAQLLAKDGTELIGKEFTEVNETLYFRADTIGFGEELWKVDKTLTGAELVKDILEGFSDSRPRDLLNHNGTLFFSAQDNPTGRELWRTDGTSAGTEQITESFATHDGFRPFSLTNVNGTLFFSGGNKIHTTDPEGWVGELWMTDGTMEGTQIVKDIYSGSESSNPTSLTNVNGTLYFAANDGIHGVELWKSDGTSEGTQLVEDIVEGITGSFPSLITNLNGNLFFQTYIDAYGEELWRSDGTSEGATIVRDIRPGREFSSPSNFLSVQGTLFFSANDGCHGIELWSTDGTSEGTELVKDIRARTLNSIPRYLTNVNGTLFFSATEGDLARELWRSDGTVEGTQLVKDLRPGYLDSSIKYLENLNGTLFFSAEAEQYDRALWRSDGTYEGTVLVKRLGGGAFNPRFLQNVNGTLFFALGTAGYESIGFELWKSDGTAEGTKVVKDIVPGPQGSAPAYLENVSGTLFFNANGAEGEELWRSDGTSLGTYLVKDIRPGTQSSKPKNLRNVNGTLFFSANDGSHGYELWMSDGTSLGTQLVKDIYPGSQSSNPRSLSNFRGKLYFQADIEKDGTPQHLWTSDGSSAGTFIYTGPETIVLNAVKIGGNYFTEYLNSANGLELAVWKLFEDAPSIISGSEAGEAATVRVFDEVGSELYHFLPYGDGFTGGVRVATGDINGDGVLDIVTAAGPGGGPHLQVFDSLSGQLITGGVNNFYAYHPLFNGGVNVAVGDVNGDGFDDIITGTDAGGGPHVKVFNGQTGAVITEFFAYNASFTGGVRVAAGDINGDLLAEIITSPGVGGGPHIKVFNGSFSTGVPLPGAATNFYAYDPNFTGGVFVAAGDVDGDGKDDIITSPGAGGGPHVKVFSSEDAALLQNFYAYDPGFLGGVKVAAADINLDNFADIITTPGASGGPHTRVFDGTNLADLANFYSGAAGNLDGLFIAAGIGLVPIEDPAPMSAPLSNSVSAESNESPEAITIESPTKKKSWYEDTEAFFQSAEEIDKVFQGLGIKT
ncbi:Hypothetical protein PBC10988_20030 [Planctomycetales bacterium 10988]|nr:Hypothetical protein PBC10988_20030 [Planctomycetales bacterium 10988]